MQISIRDNLYEFYPDVLPCRDTREGYFRLANKIFGLRFEEWYDSGYWDDKFIPYVLYDHDVAVSSVAVCVNDVSWQNTVKRYVQISTVMTLPEYREKGLNGWLMEYALSAWADKCDAIYLLGNDSVVDYYPKYGFREFVEYDFTVPVRRTNGTSRKLDLNNKDDFALMIKKYETSNPFTGLKVDNIGQFVFHCLQFLPNDIYYLEQYDAVALAKHNGNTLTCYDVFTDRDCSLGDILGVLADESTEYALLGFTPTSSDNCSIVPSQEEDNHLFVIPGKENIFRDHKVMLPLLSRA